MGKGKEISASVVVKHNAGAGFKPIDVGLTMSYIRRQSAGKKTKDWRVLLMQGVSGTMYPDVGEGWRLILERMVATIRKEGWDGRNLVSIKTQEGGLLVTFRSPTPVQMLQARLAQALSFHTCVRCARPGELTYRMRKAEILCPECFILAQKEDPNGNTSAHFLKD